MTIPEAERNEGKAPIDAIFEGAVVRFSPIMMATMAALMGTLPNWRLMAGLMETPGAFRRGPIGVLRENDIFHEAPHWENVAP